MGSSVRGFCVFEVPGGFCGIGWTDAGVARFHLPERRAEAVGRSLLRRLPGAQASSPPAELSGAVDAAEDYFRGRAVDFSDIVLDLAGQDPFFNEIYAATRRIGWGQTTTYGALAKALGAGPEVARDVGQAMASNPIPLIIPCHRVLAAGGKIGGFSAPGGAATKIRMLELEGVRVGPPPPAQQSLAF